MAGVNDINDANIGSARPLAYGYVRATGMELVYYQAPAATGQPAGTQWGFYGLGDGEWDGFDRLWVNDFIAGYNWSAGSYNNGSYGGTFATAHFHQGTDTPLGSSLTSPSSSGNDQLLDLFWGDIPDVVTRLCYSGLAYLALQWLPEPITAGQKMSMVGDWRAMKCRMFDDLGNQTSYGFTTNPIWHFVDAWLRIAIVPRTEYQLNLVGGPTALDAEATSRFDWGSVYEAAQDCDYILANGQKRFEGSYAFASQTTLTAILEQVLMCCRGYQQESAGKIFVKVDKPRSSVFLLTSKHLIPGTFTADDKQIHSNANTYTAEFLDLELPVAANIESITWVLGGPYNIIATIVLSGPNPVAPTDYIEVGGNSDANFNQGYYVNASSGSTVTAYAEDPNTAWVGTGTGGSIGYDQSRFAKRAPYIIHTQHALAEGQLTSSAGGNKSRKKLSVTLDFANMTFDQANRILKYEIYRDLGLDQSPWSPPIQITLTAWAEAVDANGNILKKAMLGQVITLDPSAFFEYAGDYEIMEPELHPFQGDSTTAMLTEYSGEVTGSGSMTQMTDQNAGRIILLLRTYNPDVFFDVSDAEAAGYFTVPGQELWAGPGPVNSNYQVLSDTLSATDAGTSVTIAWSGVQIQIGGGRVLSYADGSALSEPYSTTLYAFVDDPFAIGGNIPLQFTPNAGGLTNAPGRMFIDSIATPASGGGGTGGSGGGGGGGLPHCFVVGTPIHTSRGVMPNNQLFDWWKRGDDVQLVGRDGFEEIESLEWVKVDGLARVNVAGFRSVLECSHSTTVFSCGARDYVAVFDLQGFARIDTAKGFLNASISLVRKRGLVLAIKMRGPSHQYLVGEGLWTHNKDYTA